LADRVYSGVPAALVGRRQRIEIGPMSGRSNVIHWLGSHNIPAEPELINQLFDHAKRARAVLSEAELAELIAEYHRTRDE